MSDKPTRVELAGCRCPGTPHHHDWVDLLPDPTIATGAAVVAAIRRVGNDPTLLVGEMARVYLTNQIAAWSFEAEDEKGDNAPVPVTPNAQDWMATVERWLPWWEGGFEVANAADVLYAERVLRPLVSRTSKRSLGGPMDGSTSPTPVIGSRRPKRSSPSLPISSGGTP